jgi:hypothetical protein
MRSVYVGLAILVLMYFLNACGGGVVLVESTPRPDPGPQMEPIPPPKQAFDIPTLDMEWTPVSIGSGLTQGLVQALRDHETIALVLPSSANAILEERVFDMVTQAAPNTKVVARGRSMLDKLLEERGEIPYRVTMEPAGTDILGRPYYIPKEHPLNTDWLSRKKPLKGAQSVLAVRPIRVGDERLRQLRKGRQGSCEAFEKGLGEALDRGPEFFSPYKKEADVALNKAFARHLDVALPYWKIEIEETAKNYGPGDMGERCLNGYRSLLKSYEPCISGSCESGPELYLVGGGAVAMIDNGLLIPKECPQQGMRNYAAEIEDLASRAVLEVLPALDSAWTTELLRRGGLERLGAGIKEICAPRHRRIAPDALQTARADVTGYLTELKGRELGGEWEQAGGMERVAGVGPVNVLARVRISGYDPIASATQLTERLRGMDRCDTGRENLFQAALIGVGTSEVVFMGVFFEEELLCNGLAPGSP